METSSFCTNESSSSPSSTRLLSSILSSSSDNSFECLSLPPKIHPPNVVRRTFLKQSLLVHPDKNSDDRAKEAFQKISAAFEVLYDEQSQRIHLEDVLAKQYQRAVKAEKEKKKERDEGSSANKKRKTKHDWKQKSKEKKAAPVWAQRSWEDVVAEMRRREELERSFVRRKSDERFEKKVKGLVWKAMKVCRVLDERAGCPPTFVNGLWAPLYEHEVLQSYSKQLPEGWEIRWNQNHEMTTPQRIYRNIRTGEEHESHPDPKVERMIEQARKAEGSNKFRFQEQTRLFLGEIVEYLREDHDYFDMDEDIQELEEYERARNNPNTREQSREYDY